MHVLCLGEDLTRVCVVFREDFTRVCFVFRRGLDSCMFCV